MQRVRRHYPRPSVVSDDPGHSGCPGAWEAAARGSISSLRSSALTEAPGDARGPWSSPPRAFGVVCVIYWLVLDSILAHLLPRGPHAGGWAGWRSPQTVASREGVLHSAADHQLLTPRQAAASDVPGLRVHPRQELGPPVAAGARLCQSH